MMSHPAMIKIPMAEKRKSSLFFNKTCPHFMIFLSGPALPEHLHDQPLLISGIRHIP
jgi:hypothetical protein